MAAALAAAIDGEVISADSRQVYKGMDIGTGKDLDDYIVDGRQIPYHLIDIAMPGEKYNVYRYQQDFRKAYDDIRQRGKEVILCGGTGLYLEAILKNYTLPEVGENKELRQRLEGKNLEELTAILQEMKAKNGTAMHNKTDVDTAQRAIRAIEIEDFIMKREEERKEVEQKQGERIDSIVVGIDIDRDLRRAKISRRLDSRLKEGMVDEIKALLDNGINADDLIYYGLEYKFVTEYVIGKLSYQEMHDQLEIAIHQFAKRQMTWFRGMERRGTAIHWIDATLPTEEKVKRIIELANE